MGHWIVERLGTVDPLGGWGSWPFLNPVPGSMLKIADACTVQCPLAGGQGVGLFLAPKGGTDTSSAGCVVFLHDLSQDATSGYWLFYEDALKMGCSVLAINWDGHGKPCASELDFQLATRSISLVLKRIADGNDAPIFLAGHGVGATMVLASASRSDVSEMISGLVVSAPVIFPLTAFQLFLENTSNIFPWSFYRHFIVLFNRIGFISTLRSLLPQAIFGKTFKLRVGLKPWVQLSDFVRTIFIDGNLLRKITKPVVWLSPEKSWLVPKKLASMVFAHISHGLYFIEDCHVNHSQAIWSESFETARSILADWIKYAKRGHNG